MSAKTTYTCDLCRKDIEGGADRKKKGYALRWITVWRDSIGRETLEETHDWLNCPFHLCHDCIDAVADFRDSLKDEK